MKQIESILEILSEYPQLTIVSYNLAPRPNGFCYEYDDSYYGECPPRIIEKFESLIDEVEASSTLTKLLRQEVF